MEIEQEREGMKGEGKEREREREKRRANYRGENDKAREKETKRGKRERCLGKFYIEGNACIKNCCILLRHFSNQCSTSITP